MSTHSNVNKARWIVWMLLTLALLLGTDALAQAHAADAAAGHNELASVTAYDLLAYASVDELA